MAAKFLGQFLLEQGLIDRQQLLEALDLQRSSNPRLGELAQALGMLDYIQAARINERQRREDKRFGDLALEMELLTGEQVHTLLEQQRARRRQVGDILVERGALTTVQLAQALQAQEHDRGAAVRGLASGVASHVAGVLMTSAIDTCTRLVPRLLGGQCQFASFVRGADELERCQVSARVRVRAQRPLWVAIATDRAVAAAAAGAFLALPPHECDDALAEDALGELVNVLMGYIVRDVVPDSSDYRVSPPEFAVPAAELLGEEGALGAIVDTGFGSLALLVAV